MGRMGVVLSRITKCIWTVALAMIAGSTGSAGADSLILSTMDTSVIDEQEFLSGDLFSVDENPGSATLFLSDTLFVETENVDAAAHQPDGSIIFSTASQAQVGAGLFEDGDLMAHDPATGETTLWLDDDTAFFTDVDIDAAHVLDNGHVLFSVRDDVTLFPQLPEEAFYQDGDVIEYDPVAETASLYLSEAIFTWDVDENGDQVPDFANPDVDGLSMLPSGNLLLSIRSAARIGEDVYSDGEIIEYDPETGSSFVHLSLFERSATNLDVSAVAIYLPEPGQTLLLGAALAMVGILQHRARPRR
jgi:phage baseplate assembly protein gpV